MEQYFPTLVLFTKANKPMYEKSSILELVNLEKGNTLLFELIADFFLYTNIIFSRNISTPYQVSQIITLSLGIKAF